MKGLEAKNEIFGIIHSNTIYKKIIEDNCSEKIIEKYIQVFLYNEKYNVLIFQIHSNNYDQTFIYNLNGKDTLITEIIELKNVQLYKNPRVYEMNGQFDKLIFPSFTTISYDIDNIIEGVSLENYYEKVVDKLIKNKDLKNKIKNKLIEFIEKD